jgi:hypothetical protein
MLIKLNIIVILSKNWFMSMFHNFIEFIVVGKKFNGSCWVIILYPLQLENINMKLDSSILAWEVVLLCPI